MLVVFRTDSSNLIGSGHLTRCKALADELSQRGARVVFVCRDYPGNWTNVLTAGGLEARVLDRSNLFHAPLPQPGDCQLPNPADVDQMQDADETLSVLSDMAPDWLIVDHYLLDSTWERRLRDKFHKIMVIDDLADRFHECDLLLNHNPGSESEGIYCGLVPREARKMLGPRFALLRREFREFRTNLRPRDGSMNRILISFGSVDPSGETLKAIAAVDMLQNSDILVDVVVGDYNSSLREIEAEFKLNGRLRFHCPADSMAKLMSEADLSIGAGGVTSLERCCLGLPAVVKPIVANQVSLTTGLFQAGAIEMIPSDVITGPQDYLCELRRFDSGRLIEMGLAAGRMVDGFGCARVAESLFDF